MKLLIVFDTYSGGTLDAVTHVSTLLSSKGHSVGLKKALEVQFNEFSTAECIIFATPSWMVDDKDGQPHINFKRILDSTKDLHLQNKKVAIFGLGDEAYAHFAGGTDVLAKFVKERGGILLGTPLKIDSYYATQETAHKKLTEWVDTLDLS